MDSYNESHVGTMKEMDEKPQKKKKSKKGQGWFRCRSRRNEYGDSALMTDRMLDKGSDDEDDKDEEFLGDYKIQAKKYNSDLVS
mmetsp:Transcript_36441/g.27024  ORF Transcript_36441/g.27024 Transcript_36441/m.27024 type:complete len:84 (+) Transcript_36441:253-504(+)|eukprot:CAMPEP_0202971518 /NCGR_PEP_ID=MMETSP1396-20130829/28209_1 /ASSEMBLY_ACC=CAM_ASM_000872 /TAXON_ID= /ORGANISM="Pseudokeronopsis sp., Strain Brazil" /LENGTH=83 /DNA_ID=CAMNT_0049700987 /DNA_START=252 /DNA_END=503 /DNA_ORIENTATION=+